MNLYHGIPTLALAATHIELTTFLRDLYSFDENGNVNIPGLRNVAVQVAKDRYNENGDIVTLLNNALGQLGGCSG